MKKGFRLIALLTLGVMMIASATGAAESGGFEPPPSYTTTTDGTKVIPVYGYIGKDTNIVDPEPENPEVPPETEIYVEVPIKMMFAAFEGNGGAVSSPNYAIKNLSTANAIKVEVEDFSQKNAAEADLEGKLTLSLTDYAGTDIVPGVFPADYSSAKLFKDALSKNTGSADNVLEFKLGGNWNGEFTKQINPEFDMTLRFSAVKPAS